MEQILLILTKDKELVPFRLNVVQQRLAQYVAWCWHAGQPVYCLIPKFRQGGVTTFWQALNFTLCVLSDGHRCATVSHTEHSVEQIFSISRRFLRNLPPQYQFPLSSRQDGKIAWEKDSSIWVGSAKAGDSLGKGPTLNALHGSEVANWADGGNDPFETFQSCMGAVAKNAHMIVALESTAKGRDAFFYTMVEEALLGKNSWTVLFFPWFLDPGYAMPWPEYRALRVARGVDPGAEFVPTEEERVLRDEVGRPATAGEQTWRWSSELSDEQLTWRRFTIEQDYGGKTDKFRRYFPATLEEAFAASESALFDQETLTYYFAASQPPFAVGRLGRDAATGAVCFEREVTGELSLWDEPRTGEEYVVGADPASGKRGGDPCAGVVMRRADRRVVAVLLGSLEWDVFAHNLHLLGEWFNKALVVVERNYNPAVVASLARAGYPNLYHYVDETALRGMPTRPGWDTNRRTRPLMVERLTACVRHRTLIHPDRRFVQECASFVWWETKRHYAAASGKRDDLLMATAIALVNCYDDAAPDVRAPVAVSRGEQLLAGLRALKAAGGVREEAFYL